MCVSKISDFPTKITTEHVSIWSDKIPGKVFFLIKISPGMTQSNQGMSLRMLVTLTIVSLSIHSLSNTNVTFLPQSPLATLPIPFEENSERKHLSLRYTPP